MNNLILVDGNNLLFRSYYATAYSGGNLKNSKGFPTNALFSFIAMLNKIKQEENPSYMVVAFDKGKSFRHKEYKDYKAGRISMPEDLRLQFPVAKQIVSLMGFCCLEMDDYEADDIIGSFAKCDEANNFKTTIISSDRDLLQLIDSSTEMKLLKKSGYIRYNEQTFKDDYKIDPIKIIDMKALAGDLSDNIPGVTGIGEKTALKLLQTYNDLDGIYKNIDKIKGKQQERLIIDKETAYFSKKMATIYTSIDLPISFEETKVNKGNIEKLNKLYEELEFYSYLKENDENTKEEINYEIASIKTEFNDSEYSIYIECDKTNYHYANILGIGISSANKNYFLKKEDINLIMPKLINKLKFTYDLKKNIILLKKYNINLDNIVDDLMISTYLLEYNTKDDISYIMNNDKINIEFYDKSLKNNFENIEKNCTLKSRYIYDFKNKYQKELEENQLAKLYKDVEFPLCKILAEMEYNGIYVDKNKLKEQSEEINIKIDILSKEIYKMCGKEFNISSPKQLGEVLFDDLKLPGGKKNKSGGYKTDVKVLHKLLGVHPIIEKILYYRSLNKLYTTYLESLPEFIDNNGYIHTIYKQTLTRTGRLSSVDPNLQNIPVRDEIGRNIRKAFLPSNGNILLGADYSQIELRLLAHISNSKELIESFNNSLDIHSKVASDVFSVPLEGVTKKMRRQAKAVIFGIVYGISGFGLSENLDINPKEAKVLIDKYLEIYPDIKIYMENIIKSAKEKGYVRTLFNRKRTIEELNNPAFMIRSMGERIALNTPIQGTGADILKIAIINIDKKFKNENLKSKMILQVHDELIFDCIKKEEKVVKKIVQEEMENVIKLSVPLKVSIDEGSSWYELK